MTDWMIYAAFFVGGLVVGWNLFPQPKWLSNMFGGKKHLLFIPLLIPFLGGCTHVFTRTFEDGTTVEYMTFSTAVNDNIGFYRIDGGNPVPTHHDSTLSVLSPWAQAGASYAGDHELRKGLEGSGDNITVTSEADAKAKAVADAKAKAESKGKGW